MARGVVVHAGQGEILFFRDTYQSNAATGYANDFFVSAGIARE